jgi:hypothetical protein
VDGRKTLEMQYCPSGVKLFNSDPKVFMIKTFFKENNMDV